jgi:hypothetical protein
MAITLKRQLDESEKQKILDQHRRICFATGHPIAEGDALHFDHIRAFANDGASELDNIAPMCEVHNKQKGPSPLRTSGSASALSSSSQRVTALR